MGKYILIPNLDQLKEEIKTTKKKMFYRLMDQCQRYEAMALSSSPPAESTTYFCPAILNLSLAYLLTHEEKYLKEALRFIKTVCMYPYWGNAHLVNVDLSASWILFGLSLSYNWLYDVFTSADRDLILNKLILQSQIMFDYKEKNENKGWPTNYFQNHNWINMTGLACCGYAIKKEYPPASKYIVASKKNFSKVFSYLPDDGSDYEGVTYWRYGVLWLFLYADLVLDQENMDYFKSSAFLKNTVSYRIYQSASELRKQLNFGDCHDRYSSHSAAIYFKAASVYQDCYAQKLGNLVVNYFLYEEQYQSKLKPGILPEAWLELLWYDPLVCEENLKQLPHVKRFDDLGLISIRTSFEKDSTVFSMKCGYPGGKKQYLIGLDIASNEKKWILSLSHHHPDNLSFILTKGHSYMAIDDGYNRNIMPMHHNTLLVDRKYSDVENVNDVYVESMKARIKSNKDYVLNQYHGDIEYFHTNGSITMFRATNTPIYPLALKMKNVSRMVITNQLEFIVLIDDFDSELKHFYQSIINTDVFAHQAAKDSYQIRNGLEEMQYYTFSDDDLRHEQFEQKVESVMTTQEPDKKCIVPLNTLLTENAIAKKRHRHIEVITFHKEKVSFKEQTLQIGSRHRIYLAPTIEMDFEGDYVYLDMLEHKLALANGTMLKCKTMHVNKKVKQCMIWG
ncbi:MAG: DUF4962 domain-containing protein [Roseburia sp.]|nr:DUF4962 domain-containing protein [Anaeroplasma bactoclasticum]MCM1196210.1 DUF4962 domain-containing protein [Roseburia sp.]MCM1556023.1 DUF4962 domain-containing protein [Anaeroplasma bactoclasticum]